MLPQDEALLAELIGRENKKHCTICGKPFIPGSNRAKYCSGCSINERKRKKQEMNADTGNVNVVI